MPVNNSLGNEYMHSLECGDSSANKVLYSADGDIAVSGLFSGNVDLWDMKKMKKLFSYQAHNEAIIDIGIASSGKLLASCSYDGDIVIWDIIEGIEKFRSCKFGLIKCIEALISDDYLMLVDSSNTLKFVSLVDFEDIFTISTKTREINKIISSRDGQFIFRFNKWRC